MTECRECGQTEDLEWGTTKAGKPILMQVRRVPHFAFCAVRKTGAKPKRESHVRVKPIVAEAAKLLKDMQYTATEATDMLRDIPEGPPEEMIIAALKRKGAG